ncbi:hypothetical protein A2276_05845 [candidate division WOR-1 bacterium RIFOXYA12_FULL_43_27]|uniref:Uncharacterized protein n=1 Tax=candidate division WOR-1 bacterium RIFOXYC2_FULL_46_14 TaxID=1802587 RepID=A0A1F4U3R0_UNCSA|nr:MAG: hypothetical protein A2276_05845 [candidate division WOR-1 bacterium RIFOXYA12_FULL_43_27]OGC20184.1 MAG: hypothetical protein A2292_03845 [candidate division WOR-1 bacterium RIFOXYB2_FULL_46_45]OGC32078.1 MAG: hypothetical protein A2232_07600 [candidate division WOR-1 bacterium RIFOXYA2_FULL_46_56]OGC39480.1 MAG: hypothetical protein A2438_07965 [candidate division WOR-1 bacterium RIFOXYC2_FULL_46_14]
MAKVMLISPPYIDLYGGLNGAAGRYFPLGLGYIASYLQKYGGHDVSLFEMDAQQLSCDGMVRNIQTAKPDIIGLTCSTPNFVRAVELARRIKAVSNAKIVLGGVHASALPQYIIEKYSDCFDCLVKGEGEITMLELVDACQNNKPIKGIPGVIFKPGETAVCNEERPFIEDLDILPFPARELIDPSLFWPNMHNARYKESFSVLTSRGCPFNCSFCASRIISGRKYRTHSAEYVLSEIEMLKKDYGAKQLLITDDTFTMNRVRLEKICRGMIDKRLGLKWFCFSQVNTVDKETLVLMKKAGCYNIGFGVESANKETLASMGKPINPEEAAKTIKLANKLGFKTQAFYVLGALNETEAQAESTIEFSKKVSSTLAFYNMLVPYPGTKDFERYFPSADLARIKWDDFVAIGDNCVIEQSSSPSYDIKKLIGKAYFQYYIDPLRVLRILLKIRTFYEFGNYLKGGISLFGQIFNWSRGRSGKMESHA